MSAPQKTTPSHRHIKADTAKSPMEPSNSISTGMKKCNPTHYINAAPNPIFGKRLVDFNSNPLFVDLIMTIHFPSAIIITENCLYVKWCIALRRYDVFRFAQNDVAPLRSAMMRCLPSCAVRHTSLGVAVITRRSPTSFAVGKHHSKNAPLSVDKSAFFVGRAGWTASLSNCSAQSSVRTKGTQGFSKSANAALRVLRLVVQRINKGRQKCLPLFIGRASWTRTSECKSQSLVPYRLGDIPLNSQ